MIKEGIIAILGTATMFAVAPVVTPVLVTLEGGNPLEALQDLYDGSMDVWEETFDMVNAIVHK